MSKKPPPKKPELVPLEDSRVASIHRGAEPKAKRVLGKLDEDGSVSITMPQAVKKGAREVPRGTIGLRANAPDATGNVRTAEARDQAKDKVREHRDERRQRVWDKLDQAKRMADEKSNRFEAFTPKKKDP